MPELIKKDAGEQPDQDRSPGIRNEISAVLDFSGIGTAIRTGSRTLACRCRDQAARTWSWIAADWQFRGGAALIICLAEGERAAHHLHAVVLTGAASAVVWLAAAWMHAPAERPSDGTAPAAATEAPVAVPELLAVADLARRLADGRTAVHLADLIETGELAPWNQADLKDALTGWGVTVKGINLAVGKGRRKNRDGVRLADLPSAAPEDAAEAPSEPLPDSATAPTPGQ